MSEETTATKEFDAAISKIGDEIAGLTLTQAVDLADYMKDTYGIEAAAGGAVMMAGPAGGGEGGGTQVPRSQWAARKACLLYTSDAADE